MGFNCRVRYKRISAALPGQAVADEFAHLVGERMQRFTREGVDMSFPESQFIGPAGSERYPVSAPFWQLSGRTATGTSTVLFERLRDEKKVRELMRQFGCRKRVVREEGPRR